MKLKQIIKEILSEIGNSSAIPPNARFQVDRSYSRISFDFLGDEYQVDIAVSIQQSGDIVMKIDFGTDGGQYDMTNKNQPLKVMSYIVGCIEEWIKRYSKKFKPVQVVYIQFNPKSEDTGEVTTSDGVNARDRIYRLYIEKFAKRYGSDVSFSNGHGIIAKFNPKLNLHIPTYL